MSECFVRMIQNSLIVSIIFLVLQCIRPMLKGIRYSTFRMVWIILILFLLLPVEFKIPELTYEAFMDFHSKYYHPSNSYIYLYGNMDMAPVSSTMANAYSRDS